MVESDALLNNEKSMGAENSASLSHREGFTGERLSRASDEDLESLLDFFVPGMVDPVMKDLFVEILETYKSTQAFLLELESHSKYNFTEILLHKNTLDQLAAAFTEYAGNKRTQFMTLNLAKKYLNNVFIRAIDIFVKETSSLVLECLKRPSFYYKSAFFPKPDENRLRNHIKETESHLEMGHLLKEKNWEFSLREFNSAYIGALTLRSQIPDSNEIKHRFLGFLGFLFSLLALTVSIAMAVIS